MRRLALALAVLTGATPAAGQSLTSVRGLGYPLAPADARTEALGGLGLGLFGLRTAMVNPASAAGVLRRGAALSLASSNQTVRVGEESATLGATRFPLLRIVFPIRGIVITGGYGSYLDQGWSMIREGTATVGTGTVDYRDVVESVGGIGEAQVGVAVPIGSRLAVGAAIGAHIGRQDITFDRFFDTTSVGNLQSYGEERSRRYSGAMARLGFRWDPLDILRVAGSVTWSGTMTADSVSGTVAPRQYELPLQIAGGVSGYLAPSILATVSGRWNGWNVTDATGGIVGPEVSVGSRDTWELGGGIEIDDPERRQNRSFPLRVGFQYRQLPFTFSTDAPQEWLGSAGVGLRLGADIENPLARLDFTIQRGDRWVDGTTAVPGLDESFWRAIVTLSVFGN